MSNQNVVVSSNQPVATAVQSQISQRQSSRCNNQSINSIMDFQSQALQKQAAGDTETKDELNRKNQLKLQREHGLPFKPLINGVSPLNQAQNAKFLDQNNEKAFQSFQQNNNNVDEFGSQTYLQKKDNVVNSQEVEVKPLNGFLPIVNSQQLMTQKNTGQQQRAVGLMTAKAHLKEPTSEQRGLAPFGEYEYKNYPGTQHIQKQFINNNGDNQLQQNSFTQHHSNSVKMEKQIKLDMKQQSLHFQANQVTGFHTTNRGEQSANSQNLKKLLPEDKSKNQHGINSSNSKVDKQRRKLLFEYGLEHNFQNSNYANGSGQFQMGNNENGGSGIYNQKSTAITGANLMGMSGQAQLQQQKYGLPNNNYGAVAKGSGLAHYQQQMQNVIGNQQNQRTPEAVSNNSVQSGIVNSNGHFGSDKMPSNKHSQDPKMLTAQAQLKKGEDSTLVNQKYGSSHKQEGSDIHRRNHFKADQLNDKKGSQQVDLPSSKNNFQAHNPNQFIAGISSAAPFSQKNISNSSHRKQQQQNQMNQHNLKNQAGQMGLLEQLILNLKAINIDKLEEKEQEQLRFLSKQYQFHLNQFQEYQKQQILSGNFDMLSFANPAANQVNKSLNSGGKDQSSIRSNNNQSGFSGSMNEKLSVSNQNSQPNTKTSNGSGLEELNNKFKFDKSDKKSSEVDAVQNSQGHIKQQSASVVNNAIGSFNNVYSSQERFVQNEKNLRDMRLKKSRQRNENTPGQSFVNPDSSTGNQLGTSAQNTEFSASADVTSKVNLGSPFFKDCKPAPDQSNKSIINGQGPPQISSQKNLNRNVSYSRIQDKNLSDMNTYGSSGKIQSSTSPMRLPGPKTSTIGDLPFSFHLNLPHPVPQINSQDIKNLSANQRVAIFKHLQKREKSKFLNIQQNKMKAQEKQIQIKFTQQRFRNKQLAGGTGGLGAPLSNVFDKGSRDRGGYYQNESRAGGISVGGSGAGMRTGMSRFVSVGQRGQRDMNGRINDADIASQAQFDKQMENLRRQWASDLRAFGIFQQNELWQFSQMNESQQRQILICNLQQGKFQSLIDEQYEMLIQKYTQQQMMIDRANPQKNQPSSKNDSSNEQQNFTTDTSRQIRPAYASALSQNQKDGQQEKLKDGQLGTTMPADLSNASMDQKAYQSNDKKEHQLQSMSEIDAKMSLQFQKGKDMLSAQREATGDLIKSEMDKSININFNDLEKKKNSNTDVNFLSKNQSTNNKDLQLTNVKQAASSEVRQPFQSKNQQSTGNKDHLKTNDFDNSEIFGSAMDHRSSLNPVQKRYEDSKDSFQECLRQILCKYQHQINLSHIQASFNQNQGGGSYLPGFSNDIAALKHRQSESAKNNIGGSNGGKVNLNTISNDKYGLRGKLKQGQDASGAKPYNKLKVNEKDDLKKKDSTIVAPNSTKSGAKKIGIDGKEVEGEGADDEPKEAVVEEVKKPRYFPPKKLPNPFESAAQEQERFIQARKEALIKYSNISKNRYKQDEKEPFKYVIRQGNNSRLISRVLEQSGRIEPRYDKNDSDVVVFPGWEPADDYYDSLYHFKWKPTSNGIKYDMISKHGLKQVVNHVRGHGSLTTKDNLFLNMKQYYESQKLNIFDVVPITLVLDYLKDDIGVRVEQFQQVLNIIEKNIGSDTDTLNKKLQDMQQQKEKSVRTPYRISPCCHNQQNLWLLKPTGFNRGIGIHLFQNFDQLRDIMCTYYGIGRGARDKSSIFQQHNHNHNPNSQAHSNADPNQKEEKMKNFTFVIQKLVERPMLYFNRKFDIRQWVLLNASDGKVFIYRESYVRTSSREYVDYDPQLPEEDQIYMQLTNNAVQKVGDDYEKYEEGNIVSVHTLFEYIAGQPEAQGRSKQVLETKYKQDIEKMIIDTFKSVKGKIGQQKYTFELLGYDFILDQDLNTYLIEVNTNPCLEESNELLRKILPRMIDDTLNIVLDPVFSQSEPNGRNLDKYKSKFPLRADLFSVQNNQKGKIGQQNSITETTKHEGYKDDFNLWKHITNLE